MPIDEQTLQRLKNNDPKLTILCLHWRQIGDSEVQALANVLKNNYMLTALNLSANKFGKAGVKILTVIIKENCTLTALNLDDNQIGSNGIQALASGLKNNHTLISLYLRRNQIGNTGTKALAQALKDNHTLTRLNLSNNKIGKSGGQALAVALKMNKTLIRLDLHISNKLGEYNMAIIKEQLWHNQTLADEFLQAAAKGNLVQVKALSQHGVSLRVRDEERNTALDMAIKGDHYLLIQFLINHGANSQFANREQKTAWRMEKNTPLSVIVNEIKPNHIPSLQNFCLFKVNQIQIKPDLLSKGQQQDFAEQVASLPEELRHRLG